MSNEKKGTGIFGAFQGALNTVKEKAQEIKIPDAVQGTLNTARDKIQEAHVGEAIKGAVNTIADKAKEIKAPDIKLPEIKLPEIKMPTNLFQKKETSGEEEITPAFDVKALSVRCVMKIIYYMMSVDGEVLHNEEEKYDEIGRELDPDYDKKKELIVSACKSQLQKGIDPEDYYETVQDGVEEAIREGANVKSAIVAPKVLLWDLMIIAYSDGHYDEKERKLLKYTARKLNIDKSIFLEMESSFLAIMDLDEEVAWIKKTDRPYLTIESMVNEIADRKNVIFESVKDLITL